jgi:hypothetical protein
MIVIGTRVQFQDIFGLSNGLSVRLDLFSDSAVFCKSKNYLQIIAFSNWHLILCSKGCLVIVRGSSLAFNLDLDNLPIRSGLMHLARGSVNVDFNFGLSGQVI